MRRIKFEFRYYADGTLLVFAKGVLAALKTNSFFPTISPPLTTLETSINSYDGALALAKEGGKANIAAKNARKQELLEVLIAIALDLMKTADGNEEMLLTTGFPLIKKPQPLPPLDTPEIQKIEGGNSVGELVIMVKSQPGVKTYMYEYTQDPITADSEWANQNSTSIKATISNLVSGKKYWCRVVAFGSGDQAMVSDPALSRVVQ